MNIIIMISMMLIISISVYVFIINRNNQGTIDENASYIRLSINIEKDNVNSYTSYIRNQIFRQLDSFYKKKISHIVLEKGSIIVKIYANIETDLPSIKENLQSHIDTNNLTFTIDDELIDSTKINIEIYDATSQPTSQPTNQLTNQLTNQPANQPTNQPLGIAHSQSIISATQPAPTIPSNLTEPPPPQPPQPPPPPPPQQFATINQAQFTPLTRPPFTPACDQTNYTQLNSTTGEYETVLDSSGNPVPIYDVNNNLLNNTEFTLRFEGETNTLVGTEGAQDGYTCAQINDIFLSDPNEINRDNPEATSGTSMRDFVCNNYIQEITYYKDTELIGQYSKGNTERTIRTNCKKVCNTCSDNVKITQKNANTRINYIGSNYDIFSFENIKRTNSSVNPPPLNNIMGIESEAFLNNTILKQITIISSIQEIGFGAFKNCTNLTHVYFEHNSQLTEIPNECFKGCINLTHIFLPDSVQKIGNNAFEDCSAIEKFLFNDNSVFYKCKNLMNAYVNTNMLVYFQNYSGQPTITINSNYPVDTETHEIAKSIQEYMDEDLIDTLTDEIFGPDEIIHEEESGTNNLPDDSCNSGSPSSAHNCPGRDNSQIDIPIVAKSQAVLDYEAKMARKYTQENINKAQSAILNLSPDEEENIEIVVLENNFYNYSSNIHSSAILQMADETGSQNINKNTWKNELITYLHEFYFLYYNTTNNNYCVYHNEEANPTNTENLAVKNLSTYKHIIDSIVEQYNFYLSYINQQPNVQQLNFKQFFYHMINCSSLESCLFFNKSGPNNLTQIGDFAFKGCTSLRNISIINSIKLIGEGAFEGCINLNEVFIEPSDSVSSSTESFVATPPQLPSTLIKIPDKCFKGCTSLEQIKFPKDIETIGESAFEGCDHLEQFGYEVGSNITLIKRHAFKGCSKLIKIGFPSNITIESNAFQSCTFVYCLVFESDVVQNNLSLQPMGLTITYISLGTRTLKIDPSKTIKYSIKSVLGDAALEGPNKPANFNKNQLGDVIIPFGVDTIDPSFPTYFVNKNVRILLPLDCSTIAEHTFLNDDNFNMFFGTTGLQRDGIDFHGDILAGRTNISSSVNFSLANSDNWRNWNNDLGTETTDVFNENPNKSVREYMPVGDITTEGLLYKNIMQSYGQISKNNDEYNEPPYHWRWYKDFYNTSNYFLYLKIDKKHITIPPFVTQIKDKAFMGHVILQSISLPNNIKSIGKASFMWCMNLRNIEFYEANDPLGSMAETILDKIDVACFYGCVSLSSFILPNTVKTIEKGAFYNCKNLTTFTINALSVLQKIDNYAFYNCMKLKNLTTNISTLSRLENYCLPSGITNYNCPSGISYLGIQNHCKELERITFHNDVSIPYIPNNCFKNCYSLTNIVIPSSVRYIGRNAFENCLNLYSVSFKDTEDQPSECTVFHHKSFFGIAGGTENKLFEKNERVDQMLTSGPADTIYRILRRFNILNYSERNLNLFVNLPTQPNPNYFNILCTNDTTQKHYYWSAQQPSRTRYQGGISGGAKTTEVSISKNLVKYPPMTKFICPNSLVELKSYVFGNTFAIYQYFFDMKKQHQSGHSGSVIFPYKSKLRYIGRHALFGTDGVNQTVKKIILPPLVQIIDNQVNTSLISSFKNDYVGSDLTNELWVYDRAGKTQRDWANLGLPYSCVNGSTCDGHRVHEDGRGCAPPPGIHGGPYRHFGTESQKLANRYGTHHSICWGALLHNCFWPPQSQGAPDQVGASGGCRGHHRWWTDNGRHCMRNLVLHFHALYRVHATGTDSETGISNYTLKRAWWDGGEGGQGDTAIGGGGQRFLGTVDFCAGHWSRTHQWGNKIDIHISSSTNHYWNSNSSSVARFYYDFHKLGNNHKNMLKAKAYINTITVYNTGKTLWDDWESEYSNLIGRIEKSSFFSSLTNIIGLFVFLILGIAIFLIFIRRKKLSI